jgi:hypothetical protein
VAEKKTKKVKEETVNSGSTSRPLPTSELSEATNSYNFYQNRHESTSREDIPVSSALPERPITSPMHMGAPSVSFPLQGLGHGVAQTPQ